MVRNETGDRLFRTSITPEGGPRTYSRIRPLVPHGVMIRISRLRVFGGPVWDELSRGYQYRGSSSSPIFVNSITSKGGKLEP